MKTLSHTGSGSSSLRVMVTAAVLCFLTAACGLTAPRSNDGYANLDSPGMGETDRTMSISLGPAALRFAARFLDEEPETQALLRSLDGVRVRTYEVHGDSVKIAKNFKQMGSKLDREGWEPVMLVQEEDELVQMYAMLSGNGVKGLTIVSADGDEVVVVNVMGDLDPKFYSDVMLALDIDDAPTVQVASIN